MNKFIKKLMWLTFAAAAVSCVNPEYDLDNIKADQIHVLDNISLPIGSTRPLRLHEVMGNLEFGEYLETYENGDYYFSLLDGQISESVEIPEFRFEGYEPDNPNQTTINDPVTITQLVSGFKVGPFPLIDIEYDVQIDQADLPEMITDIVYADVDTDLLVRFEYDINEFPFKNIYVDKGLQLVFPEWIVLGDAPDRFKKTNSHSLETVNAIAITPSNTEIRIPLDALDFSKMPDDQGIVEKGHLRVNAHVEMTGSIYLLSSDCTATGSFYPIITTYLHVAPMTVEYVEAKIDLAECASMETSFSLEDVAEEIGSDEYTLDFDNLKLNLEITNSLPFEMNFKGEAKAYTGDKNDWQQEISIAGIPAGAQNEPASYSCTCELNGFPFSPLPDRVDFSIFPIAEEPKQIKVVPGTNYSVGVDYSLTADTFGGDFCIRVDDDINGLGLEISEVEVAEAQMKLTLVNALPFDFALAAQAIDEEGNVLDNITLEMEGSIKGGTIQSPAMNPVVLKFSSKGPLCLDGVHLVMTTTVSGDSALLNRDQYIQLTDISISLPKGVTYNFNSNN